MSADLVAALRSARANGQRPIAPGADLREADLREADLRGADLRGADLRRANLWGADLREADLGGANLGYANLREANLRGANLRRAGIVGLGETPSGGAPIFPTPGGWVMQVGCWRGECRNRCAYPDAACATPGERSEAGA